MGSGLLGLFGISLEAFRIAGGLILLPLGLRLLEGRPALLGSALADDPAAAIVPIGVPLMAGPGTISLVVAEAPDAWTGRLLVSLVIGAMALGLPGPHDVDDLDAALITGAGLEQLLLASAHRSPLELLLHDLQPFCDLGGIGARAVTAQQELHHVGGYRVLAGVFAHQVFADQEASEGLGTELIEMVQLVGGRNGPSRW